MNEDIIKKYCGNVAERIRSCRSRQTAEMLKSLLCHELQNGCSDETATAALLRKVEQLINNVPTNEYDITMD